MLTPTMRVYGIPLDWAATGEASNVAAAATPSIAVTILEAFMQPSLVDGAE